MNGNFDDFLCANNDIVTLVAATHSSCGKDELQRKMKDKSMGAAAARVV